MNKSKRLLFTTLFITLISTGFISKETAASVTFNTAAGSDSDGPLAATITFTAVSGGLDITITNTQTGTFKRGQAVSGVVFTVSGLSTPSAFTNLTGVAANSADIGAGGSWTLASGTAFSATPVSGVADHWGFSTASSTVTLASAGTGAPGGNPTYMVLPSSGTGSSSGGSFAQGNFDPYILGPADFFLTVSGVTASTVLTSSNFTNLSVRFGTNPDATLPTTPSGPGDPPPPGDSPAPEPASLIVWSLLAGTVGMAALRRRTRVS